MTSDDAQTSRRRELMRSLEGEDATTLADLESYAEDLRRTIRACDQLMSVALASLDYEAKTFIFESAVISYARCFAQGIRTKVPLTAENFLDVDALAFHEHVLAIRDKHLAHSVSSFETVIPVLILNDPDVTHRGVESVGTIHMRAAWDLGKYVVNLRAIAQAFLAPLQDWTDSLKAKILASVRTGDLEAIYAQPQIKLSGLPSARFDTRRRRAAGDQPAAKAWPLA